MKLRRQVIVDTVKIRFVREVYKPHCPHRVLRAFLLKFSVPLRHQYSGYVRLEGAISPLFVEPILRSRTPYSNITALLCYQSINSSIAVQQYELKCPMQYCEYLHYFESYTAK